MDKDKVNCIMWEQLHSGQWLVILFLGYTTTLGVGRTLLAALVCAIKQVPKRNKDSG